MTRKRKTILEELDKLNKELPDEKEILNETD
jgi:hypothetical protein